MNGIDSFSAFISNWAKGKKVEVVTIREKVQGEFLHVDTSGNVYLKTENGRRFSQMKYIVSVQVLE